MALKSVFLNQPLLFCTSKQRSDVVFFSYFCSKKILRMLSLEEKLRGQYGRNGIYAGSTHFHDYWCRDSMFASFGALSIGDHEIVGLALTNFLENQRADGHIAMRIGTKNQVLRYLGLPTSSGVHHLQDKGSNETYDG